ncbi:MAG TPA: hypothetical protein VIR34_14850 [Gemmatimonadaceae bacterium]|jgi:hypothetical protein
MANYPSGRSASFGGEPERAAHSVSSFAATMFIALFMGAVVAAAHGQGEQHAHERLGRVDFPVSCSAAAQTEFDHAVALLHHMTYAEAREGFQRTATIDPRCAMAYWGIAMTLFQPLWPTRPGPRELQQGWDAVQKARELAPPSPRERLFVDAAAAFFDEPRSPDYWPRIERWERAMAALYSAYPQDPEAAAFYALSQLATAPPGPGARAHADSAAGILMKVYERNHDHPGAMHYMVHANDIAGREHDSPEIIRAYAASAPHNAHALHMPTHIYTRLGQWDAVVRGNLQAADAALEQPVEDGGGRLVWDEFPHAVEYLVYAYLQEGDDRRAAAQMERLQHTARLQRTFKTAFHLSSIPARYALERHAWSESMALQPRQPPALDWDRFTWPEAVTWFARGLGAARAGRPQLARRADDRLDELEAAARRAKEDLFARNIHVMRLEVGAWIAQAEGNRESSVATMREAVELEAATPKHPVTPAPTLPALELLGDLLLERGDSADASTALAAYEKSLELYPRRFNSLLGAARAARASGNPALARSFYEQLLAVAGGGTRQPALDEARSFLRR